MSSPDQISITASRRQTAVLPTVTAILSASLLGIGLAYGACTVLIPAIAHERGGASVPAAGDRSQDVICSGSDSTTSSQASRADQ